MKITKIREPIKVIAAFNGGNIYPVRIYWNGKVNSIKKVTGSWKVKDGNQTTHYVSCLGGNDVYYEISFSTKTLIWHLERLETE